MAGRRLKLVVTEKCLDLADVDASFKEMRCKGMAQRVQRYRLPDTGGGDRLLEKTSILARRKMLPVATTRKQIAFGRRRVSVHSGTGVPSTTA